jgi:hypothetical protein
MTPFIPRECPSHHRPHTAIALAKRCFPRLDTNGLYPRGTSRPIEPDQVEDAIGTAGIVEAKKARMAAAVQWQWNVATARRRQPGPMADPLVFKDTLVKALAFYQSGQKGGLMRCTWPESAH